MLEAARCSSHLMFPGKRGKSISDMTANKHMRDWGINRPRSIAPETDHEDPGRGEWVILAPTFARQITESGISQDVAIMPLLDYHLSDLDFATAKILLQRSSADRSRERPEDGESDRELDTQV